ncbi:LPXTG cell wall anchor domain-containing protein [Candidatus Saccharibacteria bacterium]|jgi:LPXTG-motif cell wall-anchored protein|nr:LPXTG cell wall anchor domain-containing protein [Candidatus Saccharibacteria bacterium]
MGVENHSTTRIKQLSGVVFVSILLIFSISGINVSAATQTLQLNTTTANDDIHIADESSQLVSELGVVITDPSNNIATNLDDRSSAEPPAGYSWRADLSSLCTGAQIQNIRLTTNTIAQNEAAVGGVFLGLYNTNDLVLLNNYTIATGEDGNTWLPVAFGQSSFATVDRGLGDGVNFFPASLGYAGRLDATWDITGYNQDDIGIYIQQWIGGQTTTAQTTIETAELTYDDAGCASQASASQTTSSAPEGNAPTSAQLPATGSNIAHLYLASAGLAFLSIVFIAFSKKRLESK